MNILPSSSKSYNLFPKVLPKRKPITPSVKKSISAPEKYIWGNSTYYDTICQEIKGRYTKDTPLLAFQFVYGGFGNQLYSLLTTSLMAIVGDYHLYYIYPHYPMLFDGCYVDSILGKNDIFDYKVNYPVWDIQQTIGHEDTLLNGLLMDPEKIFNNTAYFQKLQNVFSVVDANVSLWNIRRTMLQLILNPEKRLRELLFIEKKQLLKYSHTIGLQLRMGGNISDTPEKYVGIPFSRIDEVIDQVRTVIKRNGWEGNVQVYISSDSSKTIQYIQEKTAKEFPVVESKLYKHGHTSSFLVKKDYANVMRKVVSDLYYMSICDYSIVSWPSSLGRLMCFLTKEDQCEAVLGWKVDNKKISIV